MHEWAELKKKFSEIAAILKSLAGSLWCRAKSEFVRRVPNQILRTVIVTALLSFGVGVSCASVFLIGSGKNNVNPLSGIKRPSLLRFLFREKIPVPGKREDASFVFSDFETDQDLKAWKLISSKIQIVDQNASAGSKSAKVTFFGGEKISSIVISDYFRSRNGLSNWADYEALRFYLYNPRNETERIILQVKDGRENRYKRDIHVPASSGQEFTVPIDQIAARINVRAIEELTFFRWEPRQDRQFFIDDIKLVPSGYRRAAEGHDGGAVAVSDQSSQSRPVNVFDYGFVYRKPLWTVQNLEGVGQIVRVPFVLKNETAAFCHLCPAGGGIPLPMGEVRTVEHVRLKNSRNEEIPFQGNVSASWPDGSVKWLNIHFQATLAPDAGEGFFLEYGPNVKSVPAETKLQVDDRSDELVVTTGALRAHFDKRKFYLFERIFLDRNGTGTFEPDEEMLSKARLALSFRDKEFFADLDSKTYRLTVEEQGFNRVVLKGSGWFQSEDGERYCQAVVRYYFYAGKNSVKVSHTLIYTGYPENSFYDAYQGLRLPRNETIQGFGMKLPYPLSNDSGKRFQFGRPNAPFQEIVGGDYVGLFQSGWESNLLRRDGVVVAANQDYGGWLNVADDQKGIAVAIRDFRENFPKAFAVDRSRNEVRIDLWPQEAGDLDLSTTSNAIGPGAVARGSAFGFAKTHELLFHFHRGYLESNEVTHAMASFAEPLLIRSNPHWVDATGALGRLHPVSQQYAAQERVLEELFGWASRHPKDFKWYGMLDFGDTLSWWRNQDEEQWYGVYGWHPVGRWGWYNGEGVGTHTGALLQFIRSGEWKYFEFGGNLARHIMDVDTVHYNTIASDPRLKNVLDDRLSKVGSMHRHNGDHWGGRNDEASHTNVLGLVIYYYLTGDARALDVIQEVGEFYLQEPFTYIGHPDIAPNRAMANTLWGDVLIYQLTGDERFKSAADRIIEIFLAGQQSDGSFLENYNPLDRTWSGEKHMLFMSGYILGAIMSYHELTQDRQVKDMFLKLIHFLSSSDDTSRKILNGFAYAYLITRDPQYLMMAEKRLHEIAGLQQSSGNSLMDGLIYKKAIYHRSMTFLSTVPYVFGALEEGLRDAGR